MGRFPILHSIHHPRSGVGADQHLARQQARNPKSIVLADALRIVGRQDM
jgi:hypothetical protein